MRIIIRNLSRETTEPQLRALFEEYGEVIPFIKTNGTKIIFYDTLWIWEKNAAK